MQIDKSIVVKDLKAQIPGFWSLSGQKIMAIESRLDTSKGAPVFTERGKYTSKGWTEWTQGFQYGASILQYEATEQDVFLELGRKNTIHKMAPHLSHIGVHDHGFNNISTYGNLLRLMNEQKLAHDPREKEFYELALKMSAAVQASRWTDIADGGYIYSFNGPHSLFVDTMRTIRILELGHLLGHYLPGEQDVKINLLHRAIQHGLATARYIIYYGEQRDMYDEWGRTSHEAIFNVNNGQFRCPNSQQGYSGFTTWMRGLSWAVLGFAEQLELLEQLPEEEFEVFGGRTAVTTIFLRAARAVSDFYISNSTLDGLAFWDAGAPGLYQLGDYTKDPSDPFNDVEPIDSSASAIAAQGLVRLGNYLSEKSPEEGGNYLRAGLTITKALLNTPYLSTDPDHEGLLLHTIYHRPNGWDYIPVGRKIPCGESCMWGDYHMRELILLIDRMIKGDPYYTFFAGLKES